MDQNILPQQGGEFVNLFGLPVPISKSAAGLASHTGAAIVFTYCVADTEGNYQAYALPPIRASEQRHQEKEVTHAIAQMLENVIKKHPDQWLWMYKRWKFIPDGKSPNEYPFYARRLKTEDSGEQE
jgi:lauroyl/myristoyl acyltransferase